MDRNDDPALRMDAQLAEAYRLAARLQEELGAPEPGIEGLRRQVQQAREWWNVGGPAMAREIEAEVPVADAKVRVVVYVPREHKTPQPAYLYLHGGGFRHGEPRSNDRMLRELAAAWGGIVVSVDYVHIPEHVFPTAVTQTAQVYRWIRTNGAVWGVDGSRLAFGGSSAGASIALGAAIHLGAEGRDFLRAGALLVGNFDIDHETESMRVHGGGTLFPSQAMARSTLEQYVPDPALRSDPRVNCVAADPSLFPPLFIAAAELDVFRDSSRKLAAVMEKAGRPYRLVEYPGMGHLFAGYTRTVDVALRCVRDMAAFLGEHLR